MEELKELRKSQYWEYLTDNDINIDKLIAYTTQRKFEKNEKIIFKKS